MDAWLQRNGEWLALAVILLLGLAFVAPIFENVTYTGSVDWDQFCFWDEAARKTILEYNQFPLWNPYSNGGRPLLANPQSGFLRPAFLFSLGFGCVVGQKLEIALMLLVGILGMWFLAKYSGVSAQGRVISCALFCFSTYFSLRVQGGLVSFFQHLLLPWILFCFVRARENRQWLVACAGVIMLAILGGASVHLVVPLSLFVGFYGVAFWAMRNDKAVLVCAVLVVLLALGLGAFKALPVFEYLVEHPRSTETNISLPFAHLLDPFLERDQFATKEQFPKQHWLWLEYGAFIGVIGLALGLYGVWLRRRQDAPLLVAAGTMFVLAVGDFAAFAPWSVLHKLPLMSSTHIPSRYLIFAVLALALCAGHGYDALKKRLARYSWGTVALALIFALAIADVFVVGQAPLRDTFTHEQLAPGPAGEFKQVMDLYTGRSGAFSSMYLTLQENKGAINGYDPVLQRTFASWEGNPRYKGEAYLLGKGNATYASWSPNRMTVAVRAEEETVLVVNQNYAAGWRVPGKGAAENVRGLLGITVTPEDTQVTFVYRPRALYAGIAITLLTIAGLLVYGNTRNARTIALALFIAAGLLAAGVLFNDSARTPVLVEPENLKEVCVAGTPCENCGIYDGKRTCFSGTCTPDGACGIPLWEMHKQLAGN